MFDEPQTLISDSGVDSTAAECAPKAGDMQVVRENLYKLNRICLLHISTLNLEEIECCQTRAVFPVRQGPLT